MKTMHASIKCDGGEGPFGHPLVYLAFNEEEEVICPYCGTCYTKKGGHPRDPGGGLYENPTSAGEAFFFPDL